MKNPNMHFNSIIIACVLAGDMLICAGILYLFKEWAQLYGYSPALTGHFPQIMVTLLLSYLVCNIRRGVILHRTKVYAFQIVMTVFKNVLLFALLSAVVLMAGKYLDAISVIYLVYIVITFVVICVWRLMFRGLIKEYRRHGGNMKRTVLVGSTSNNRELFHELTCLLYTSDAAAIA